MPDSNITPPKTHKVINTDSKKPVIQGATVSTKAKEQEPVGGSQAEEDKLMAEIVSTSEATDSEALAKLRKEAPDIKRSQPRPELKPDVEDAGVKVPEEEADKVVKSGSTLSLPVSEKDYQQGSATELGGKVVGTAHDKDVVGVSGISALALWIGRLLKMAHKHTMRVIFRGGR